MTEIAEIELKNLDAMNKLRNYLEDLENSQAIKN
jgi:hypothetical protein